MNLSGCGNEGLLDFFQAFWNVNRVSVSRDAAQLFSGTGLECDSDGCVIGCAFRGATCYYPAWSYGVNFVSYTSNRMEQSNLVAHELGHNIGKLTATTSFPFF